MNIIDLFVIGLCVLFGILGIARGMVRQLFSLGGLVAGHLAGIRFYASAASALRLHFKYAEVVGYIIVFLVVAVAISFLGSFIEEKIRGSKLSGMDRVLGLAVGLAKGALLAVLLVFVLVILLPKDAEVIRESKTAPRAIAAGRWLAKTFPPRIAETFREKIRAAEQQPPGGPRFSF